MLSDKARDALATLTMAIDTLPELEEALGVRWRGGMREGGHFHPAVEITPEQRAAADVLAVELPGETRSEAGVERLAELLARPEGRIVLAWCRASAWRRDTRLAPLLGRAAAAGMADLIMPVARDRVVEGPMLDALSCAPLLGDGSGLSLLDWAEARARLEILVWEAGSSAREVPFLGPWLWGSRSVFDTMIAEPAHGALRGRVLAARCLEVSIGGMPTTADQELFGRTLQILQPLLLHPEPLVWVHAARALGRLAGVMEQMEGTILDWALGESRVLRQRATTALASLPGERLKFLSSQIVAIIDSRGPDAPWVLASVAAATPYLFHEHRELWGRLARRVLAGEGGAIAARALARGLATLWRRGDQDPDIERPLRTVREMARAAHPDSIDEARRWIEVTAVTDPVDGAERDPLDIELGVENLLRMAAQFDDEEADARAARFAGSLATTFEEARRIATREGRLRQRAASMNALEGCARTFALRLWWPLLATHPAGDPIDEPDLSEAWKLVSSAPAQILDLVRERRQKEGADPLADVPLEVLAIRLGGYALDACGEDSVLGPGRGPTAHETCLWLRKLDGLADGSRELPPELKSALSMLFWRLVDTTRGTALGEVDDVQWLGPFAAWWGLVIDQPAMLLQLATALPMMAEGALAQCCAQADALRTAVSLGMPDGDWSAMAADALAELHAGETELAHALSTLASSLAAFSTASGPNPKLEDMCLNLVLAGERLQGALADPVKALRPATAQNAEADDSATLSAIVNAPRVAALVARAIRAREPSLLDVWFASLGPVASALLEAAVESAIGRTPPPPPQPKRKEPKVIEGYELVKPLGEGGVGSVWLVRKPGADRLFVLKIPKAEALAQANETEREGILASFVEEAKALAGLYHPNVANIIDRGVASGVPFLVLAYLIGADLKQYSTARLMSLFELRQVVLESCAGLAALHGAGLVHRDIKPANIWLRLPLPHGERFDPDKHRDPARTQPLASVVIDFGMVRSIRVAADAAGRFVAGTAGYIAPEQVLDPVELDPRSDVYSLAATIYNVTTGRAFFDDIENQRDKILAHMRRDPLEEAERLQPFPAAIAKLLRAATLKDPRDRPQPLEFGREFAASV
ncbi:MAG TPA: serine/threonine-protein kinase [Polyangiaceae bacterium]|nr:serine/threonine-protein kinase [Polyangiaceae bacterium]